MGRGKAALLALWLAYAGQFLVYTTSNVLTASDLTYLGSFGTPTSGMGLNDDSDYGQIAGRVVGEDGVALLVLTKGERTPFYGGRMMGGRG